MRSAEPLRRWGLTVAAVAMLSGCSVMREPLPMFQPDPTVRTAPVPAANGASAPLPAAARARIFDTEAAVPPAAQRAYREALQALRDGRTEQGERGLRALAQSHPELGGPHANLGLIYRQAGKLPEAVAAFEQALLASPQQPVYLNQLGITYRQQGEFAKARAAYEQSIVLDATYAAPVLNLGILHDLYLGDGRQALVWYDRYLLLQPGGDAKVSKWVADLKNRKAEPQSLQGKKEQP